MSKLKWEKPVLHPLNTDAVDLAHAVCASGSSPATDPSLCTTGNGAGSGVLCARGNGNKGLCTRGNGARL